eukprot:m.248688 g.248688  ORF g.248688 m.248688 type:complete len:145 (-) comp15813_c0_seq1:222-656(-)
MLIAHTQTSNTNMAPAAVALIEKAITGLGRVTRPAATKGRSSATGTGRVMHALRAQQLVPSNLKPINTYDVARVDFGARRVRMLLRVHYVPCHDNRAVEEACVVLHLYETDHAVKDDASNAYKLAVKEIVSACDNNKLRRHKSV